MNLLSSFVLVCLAAATPSFAATNPIGTGTTSTLSLCKQSGNKYFATCKLAGTPNGIDVSANHEMVLQSTDDASGANPAFVPAITDSSAIATANAISILVDLNADALRKHYRCWVKKSDNSVNSIENTAPVKDETPEACVKDIPSILILSKLGENKCAYKCLLAEKQDLDVSKGHAIVLQSGSVPVVPADDTTDVAEKDSITRVAPYDDTKAYKCKVQLDASAESQESSHTYEDPPCSVAASTFYSFALMLGCLTTAAKLSI